MQELRSDHREQHDKGVDLMFRAHVEATFESAHANGPVGHKCHVMHGHSWLGEIEWEYDSDKQDEFGWGPDFGKVKELFRRLDHQDLNEFFVFPPSAENIAQRIYKDFIAQFGFAPLFVKLHEGRGNIMTYTEPEND